MYAKAVALVVMGALAAAGCATAPDANTVPSVASTSEIAAATVATSPTASTSPQPTPAPTPTPVLTQEIKAMGEAYVEFSDWLRQTSSANDQNGAAATTDAEIAALYVESAALFTEAVARLSKLELPDSLEADRAAMIAALTTGSAEFVKLSLDVSYDPGAKIADAGEAVAAAGGNIREALGLPPAPTPEPSP